MMWKKKGRFYRRISLGGQEYTGPSGTNVGYPKCSVQPIHP